MSDLIEKLKAWLSREQDRPGVDASEAYGLERMLDLLRPVIEAVDNCDLDEAVAALEKISLRLLEDANGK